MTRNNRMIGKSSRPGEPNKGDKPPFWAQLIMAGARSYILWTARVLILSWYVYGILKLSEAHGRGGGYLYLAMAALSVFGLFQLIELLATFLKLKEPRPQSKRLGSQDDE